MSQNNRRQLIYAVAVINDEIATSMARLSRLESDLRNDDERSWLTPNIQRSRDALATGLKEVQLVNLAIEEDGR